MSSCFECDTKSVQLINEKFVRKTTRDGIFLMLQTLSRVYVSKALDCLTSNWFLNTLATQHKKHLFSSLRCCGILGLRQAELVANNSTYANKSGRDVMDHLRTLGLSAKNFAMQLASADASLT